MSVLSKRLSSFCVDYENANNHVKKRSPTLLAPQTGFVKDNFSTDRGSGVGSRIIPGHYIQVHLLLYGLVPHRPGLAPVHARRLGTLMESILAFLYSSSKFHRSLKKPNITNCLMDKVLKRNW